MDKLPSRKDIRLKNYDYSQAGYYFITICTRDRQKLFWNVGAMCNGQNVRAMMCNDQNVGATCGRQSPLSKIGEIVDLEINKINYIYEDVEVNKYVIMPNHMHIIIVLQGDGRSETAPTISRVIQQFKGSISKQVVFSVWQKSFYDHIIKYENEYEKIYEYIETNPLKWKDDEYYSL